MSKALDGVFNVFELINLDRQPGMDTEAIPVVGKACRLALLPSYYGLAIVPSRKRSAPMLSITCSDLLASNVLSLHGGHNPGDLLGGVFDA